MKTILAMRHAQSDYPPDVKSDYERTLSERGLSDLPRMGALLHQCETMPEYVLSSSAQRARQTAAGLAKYLGLPPHALHFEDALYLASPSTLLGHIQRVPDRVDTLLVVAHNPGMEELICLLSGARVTLPSAGLAAIALGVAQWSAVAPAHGRLSYFVTPGIIKPLSS